MTEKTYRSPRGPVHYWLHKRDTPVTLVFLHGLTANHHLFDRQVSFFSKRYSVLVWDAPGHGTSRPYQDFSYPNLAEDLKHICDIESIRKAVLVGQSMGGFAAQSVLSQYPHLAAGFVAIGSCPYGPCYYSKLDLWWLKQIEWMAHLFPDQLLRRAMARQCGLTSYGRDSMLEMLQDYSKDELCHLMYLGFTALIPELHTFSIPCPVCLIVGEHDHTGKVRSYNQLWNEKEGYPLHIIQDAAHNANADQPDAVNAILEAFVSSLSG